MNLDVLQSEVGQWARENFGSQPPSYPLVGATEEIGELAEAYLIQQDQAGVDIDERIFLVLALQAEVGRLAHSVLKRTQGIRADDEDVGVEAEKEAIAVARVVLKDLHESMDQPHPGREVDLDALPDPTEEVADSVADTLIYLCDFSERAGLALGSEAKYTWQDIVSERDWDSDVGGSDV